MWITVESANTIYMDYAATTPLDPKVLESMLPYFAAKYSNPSSLHSSGRRAKRVISEARDEVARVINASPEEIIFTGSGTESDNLALLGIARAYAKEGNHIIISAVEHKAVIEAARQLEQEGFLLTILPVDKFGMISVDECIRNVTSKTILISVMYANNEIGTIEPIKELAEAIRSRCRSGMFPFFHTDACQAAGFLSLDVKELGVDLMTLNGSKIYGPKGIGMLYKRKGIRISPIIVGGEQEMNIRAGTESLSLIVGFARALKRADGQREAESRKLAPMRDYFIRRLAEEIPDIILNGHPEKRLPNNIHVSLPFIEGESILLMLDTYGIEASTGSACSAFDLKPSHVLIALGQSSGLVHGSIRFSLGRQTTLSQINQVMSVFPGIIETLKNMSSLTVKKYE